MSSGPEDYPHLPETIESSIRAKMKEFNLILSALPEGEERDQFGFAAVDELDEAWNEAGVMNAECHISGKGTFPLIEVYTDEDGRERVRYGMQYDTNAAVYGWSRGIAYGSHDDESLERLWFMVDMKTPLVRINRFLKQQFSAVALFPEDAVIYFVPPNSNLDLESWQLANEMVIADHEAELEPLPQPKIMGIQDELSKRSDELMALLASTAFRRKSHRSQKTIVDRLISQAEQDTGVRDSLVSCEPQYGYVSAPSEDSAGDVIYQPLGFHGEFISGVCRALTMIGRERLQKQAIRKDAHLVSKHLGLVMSVELREECELSATFKLPKGLIVHIPVSGQEYVALFAQQSNELPPADS